VKSWSLLPDSLSNSSPVLISHRPGQKKTNTTTPTWLPASILPGLPQMKLSMWMFAWSLLSYKCCYCLPVSGGSPPEHTHNVSSIPEGLSFYECTSQVTLSASYRFNVNPSCITCRV
jgi:hypothetical protein